MLSVNKNLKDSTANTIVNTSTSITDISFSISYTKTHKLITALYMVTDIIDKEEPIRNKLRILGTEIISDMHSIPANAGNKIAETVSFLNIASAMNFISEMNCTILKKEFLELKGSIQEYVDTKPTWLADFFETPSPDEARSNMLGLASHTKDRTPSLNKGSGNFKGHTRIGVQKGSTLLKALSEVERMRTVKEMSDRVSFSHPTGGFGLESNVNYEARPNMLGFALRARSFDILKKQRRDNIINIIKDNGGNNTIKDIRTKMDTGTDGSLACSEKTLQRELMSMIKDGVLYKTGEKRWSRYFIKNQALGNQALGTN